MRKLLHLCTDFTEVPRTSLTECSISVYGQLNGTERMKRDNERERVRTIRF